MCFVCILGNVLATNYIYLLRSDQTPTEQAATEMARVCVLYDVVSVGDACGWYV